MIEMIAPVKMPKRYEFQDDAKQQGRAKRQHHAEDEIPGPGDETGGKVGAHHIERAVRQIDEIHDAEHQRQSRRQQKQQQAELQSVQELFDDKQHGRFEWSEESRLKEYSGGARAPPLYWRTPTITSSGIYRGSYPDCPSRWSRPFLARADPPHP